MTEEDRRRWDERHAEAGEEVTVALPARLSPHAAAFPTRGRALDVACGRGGTALWLAQRGLEVLGIDVSAVAIARATALDTTGRCRFEVADLDDGLPPGEPVDVLVCHRFRDPRLYGALRSRLTPGGLLALVVLSEVGAAPGPFRARPGELLDAFGDLEVLDAGEAGGEAWLVARAPHE